MSNEISIPTLVVVCVLGGLVFKYLFFPSSSASGGAGSPARDSLSQQRQREQAVERIQQMFPQAERRTILWDLQRNGGSIATTTERILSGTVQSPPITFQPPPPPGSNTAATSATSSGAKPVDKPAQPNLIQRYNLQDKVTAQSAAEAEDAAAAAKKWSTNKDERQTLLQTRRDEMILQARRKMEAKVAAEAEAAGKAS